jgi:hypothetical protein
MNCIHFAAQSFGPERLGLGVWADGSAILAFVENGDVQGMRDIEPHEDGTDIALLSDAKEWFDRELAAGRAKAKAGAS